MDISSITSIKRIEKQYGTGEEPVLVVCSDFNQYVCKYMRSSVTSFKLACELIGWWLAMRWRLPSPPMAFVRIKHEHWTPLCSFNLSAPAFGSRKINTVVDITPSTSNDIPVSERLACQMLRIALFDIWLANEDRNWNNANLLYDISADNLVVIDHGCIFNTATFDYPLCQLTTNETILCSDLAHNLLSGISDKRLEKLEERLKTEFEIYAERCKNDFVDIMNQLPSEWHIDRRIVEKKLFELADEKWISGCWECFEEYLNDNKTWIN